MCGNQCGCHCGCGHHQRPYTKEEQREKLKRYAEDLEKELEGVRERLKEPEA